MRIQFVQSKQFSKRYPYVWRRPCSGFCIPIDFRMPSGSAVDSHAADNHGVDDDDLPDFPDLPELEGLLDTDHGNDDKKE